MCVAVCANFRFVLVHVRIFEFRCGTLLAPRCVCVYSEVYDTRVCNVGQHFFFLLVCVRSRHTTRRLCICKTMCYDCVVVWCSPIWLALAALRIFWIYDCGPLVERIPKRTTYTHIFYARDIVIVPPPRGADWKCYSNFWNNNVHNAPAAAAVPPALHPPTRRNGNRSRCILFAPRHVCVVWCLQFH